MNIDTIADTSPTVDEIHGAPSSVDERECVSFSGIDQLSARPDDFVILFLDEDTARNVGPRFERDFVCVSMKKPWDADDIDLEPLRERCVCVWPSRQAGMDDNTWSLMWSLQDEVDAEIYTPAQFLELLV